MHKYEGVTRLKRAVGSVLLLCLLVTLVPYGTARAAENGVTVHYGNVHPPYYRPWFEVLGTTMAWLGSEAIVVGGGASGIRYYRGAPLAPAETVSTDAPVLLVEYTNRAGVVAVDEQGNAYSIFNSQVSRYKLAAPPGEKWEEDDVGPIWSGNLGTPGRCPFVVKLGKQLYKVIPESGAVQPWDTELEIVHTFIPARGALLVVAEEDGELKLIRYQESGSRAFTKTLFSDQVRVNPGGSHAAYLSSDGEQLQVISAENGLLISTIPITPDQSWELGAGELLLRDGTHLQRYSLDGYESNSDLDLERLGSGNLTYTVSSYPLQALWYQTSSAIYALEPSDGSITWQVNIPPDEQWEFVRDSAYGLVVSTADGRLKGWHEAASRVQGITLTPGSSIMIPCISQAGSFDINITRYSAPVSLGLAYTFYKDNPASPTKRTAVLSGVMTGDSYSRHVSKFNSGTAYLVLEPVQLAPADSDVSQEITFGLGLDGAVAVTSLSQMRPPTLHSSQSSIELWGTSAGEVQVMASRYAWVRSGDTSAIQSQGEPLSVPLITGEDLHQVVLIEAYNSIGGPQSSTQVSVTRHWMTVKPAGRTGSDGTISLVVPDAGVVDLERSKLEIGGVAYQLATDSDCRKLNGTPQADLPDGQLEANLQLFSLPTDGNEGRLLDEVCWQVNGAAVRTAKLWIGKRSGDIDGADYSLEAAPYVSASRTMVPIRFVGDAMQARLGWNNSTKQASFELDGQKVVLTIGSREATVNGQAVLLDAAPTVVSSRTFVPLRFVSESLGAKVDWQGTTKQITLTIE